MIKTRGNEFEIKRRRGTKRGRRREEEGGEDPKGDKGTGGPRGEEERFGREL